MSQTTKDLNKIDVCVDISQSIHYFVTQFGENSERVKRLRDELISEIPATLVKILTQASDSDLCTLTRMKNVDGVAVEVRKAAGILFEHIETIDDMKRTRLLSARR